ANEIIGASCAIRLALLVRRTSAFRRMPNSPLRGDHDPMERSYVIYATMPWNGPWNVEHNIAHAVAARHPVLYVDPPLSPATPFRYGLTDASPRQLADVVDRRTRRSGRLQVFTPLALPPLTHPRMQRASLPLVRAQIRRAVTRAG